MKSAVGPRVRQLFGAQYIPQIVGVAVTAGFVKAIETAATTTRRNDVRTV